MVNSGGSGPPYGGGSYPRRSPLFDRILRVLTLEVLGETWRRRLLGGVGVGALALALLLVAAPWLPVWLVGPFLPLLVLAWAGQAGVILVGLVGAGVGLVALYRKTDSGASDAPEVQVPTLPGDRRAEWTVDPPGQRLDTLVARVSGDAENPSQGVNRRVDRRQVRKQLADVAVEVLHDNYPLSAGEARTLVDEGEWTESRRAAGFLGGPGAPRPRLSTRIRDWASGDPFERRVHATVDEIARAGAVPGHEELLEVPLDRTNRSVAPGIARDGSGRSAPALGLDRPGSADAGPDWAERESDADRRPSEGGDGTTGDDDGATGEDGSDATRAVETEVTGSTDGGASTAGGTPEVGGSSTDEGTPGGGDVPGGWIVPWDPSGRPDSGDPAGDDGDGTPDADGGESP